MFTLIFNLNNAIIHLEFENWEVTPKIFTCYAFFGYRSNGDYSKISTTINWYLDLGDIDLENLEDCYDEDELEDLGLKDFEGYTEDLLNTPFVLSFDLDNSKAYLTAYREGVLLLDKELCDLDLSGTVTIYDINFTNKQFEITIDSENCKVALI